MNEISFICYFGIWILIALLPFGGLQQVTIRRLDDNPVCPEQRISFQCTTVGSAAIAWSSTDFIGLNVIQIEFVDSEALNTPKMSQAFPETVAVLTSKGSGVLSSMLTVTVTSANLNPSVTCINGDHNTDTTFSFQVLSDPDVPATEQNPILREYTQGACILSVLWMEVTNATRYIVDINGTHQINETLPFISVVVPECTSYGVRVRSVNQCGQMSPYSSEILPNLGNIRELISFDSPSSFTTETDGDTPTGTIPRIPRDDILSTVLIILAVILFVAAVILFLVSAILVCIWWKKKDSKNEGCNSNNQVTSTNAGGTELPPTYNRPLTTESDSKDAIGYM